MTTPVPLAWPRYIAGAIVAAVIGYLIGAYVPIEPLAHIVSILLYVIAAIALVYGVYLAIFGGGYRLRR